MKRTVYTLALGLLVASAGVANAADTAAAPTFTKDVAPILYNNCVRCHRAGEVAPMQLITYNEVRPWIRAIKDKVVKREMPPWSADMSKSVKIKNDPTLTQKQIDTIAAWVDGGAAKGDDKDLPALPKFAEGWKNGEPDQILEMPFDYQVAAEGEIPNESIFMKNPLTEEKWVEAIEIRGNTRVLHHGNAYVVDLPKDTVLKDGKAYDPQGKEVARNNVICAKPGNVPNDVGGCEGPAKLLSYVPGRGYERYGNGAGKRIVPGSYIMFSLHYQPDGVPETDRLKVGLYYSKTPITHEIFNSLGFIGNPTNIVEGKELGYQNYEDQTDAHADVERAPIPNIPPYADNWKLVSVTPVQQPVTIYGLTPHLHLRGKSMQYIVTLPDGKEVSLLNVPKYDFNWQFYYDFDKPYQVPAGSKITVVTYFDNSLKNPYNPAPEKEVFWSEQSWDEMYSPQIRAVFDNVTVGQKTNTQQQ